MSYQAPYKFIGWNALDEKSIQGNMVWQEYQPKDFDEDHDVDIKILYASICASDLHTMSGGWGKPMYPQVVGHEIVGEIVKVGKNVKGFKEGQMVGVGAQGDSCLKCEECQNHEESYCLEGQVGTYNGKYKYGVGAGQKSYGGYALYARARAHFVVPIPDNLDPSIAAPLMCAGATVYQPLKRYEAKGKSVGVIGIGGLGHLGIQYAKALGAAHVYAISHSESKKEDATKMGADGFIATHGSSEFAKEHAASLDLIIATTNDRKMPLNDYLALLKKHGTIVFVGAPEEPLPPMATFPLIMNNIHITGSAIASPSLIAELLQVAADKDVKPWVQKRPMKEANQAVVDMDNGKARYRYVLVNEENGGKL